MDQGGNFQCEFQGNCRICGMKGHKSRGCKKKCPHCGKTGHAAQNCFELEVNAHRRPQGWRPCAQRAADGGDVTVPAGNVGEHL